MNALPPEFEFGSVCSGIDAASVAWEPLGWRAAFVAEIEAFPSALLGHRYPNVPNHGDITKYQGWPDATINVLVGGTPCQSFSVAGLRKGLADPRGNLALTYLAIADRYRPEWLVWENVPGVLSSNGGRDFGAFLGGLGELGYGFAYRVLDAQYVRVDGFGRAVPQRRRRVFVVGNSRSWRCAAAVLFEPESLRWDTAPRREAGQGIARPIAAGSPGSGGYRNDADTADSLIASCLNGLSEYGTGVPTLRAKGGDCAGGSEALIAFGGNNCSGPVEVSPALQAHPGPKGRMDFASEAFIATPISFGGQMSVPQCDFGLAQTLQAKNPQAVAAPYTLAIRGRDGEPDLEYRQDGTANAVLTPNGGRAGIGVGAVAFDLRNGTQDEIAMSLQSGGMGDERGLCPNAIPHTFSNWAVRRLTPTECERLQGFPDGYTAIPYRNKPAADGPRYKALGNSMAVNVMRWLGHRIQLVRKLSDELARAA